jgi:quercetin dioxygenase-like cupin family protein
MSEATVQVWHWSEAQPPTEAEVRQRLAAEGLQPYSWANDPGDVYRAHRHSYHKVIYVLTGSLTFGLPGEGRQVTLNAGDRLELPPGVEHDAVVGPQGVACLEAHRP